MEGSWLYSRMGDVGLLQNFIFLFLMLINKTKEQDGFKIISLAEEIERLSLDLTQATKSKGIWDCLEFVYGLRITLAKSRSLKGASHQSASMGSCLTISQMW